MGDVANILGFEGKAQRSAADEATRILADTVKTAKKSPKEKGMSRELSLLLGKDSLAPSIQTSASNSSMYKRKMLSSLQGKWVWAPFTNSGRRYVMLLILCTSPN